MNIKKIILFFSFLLIISCNAQIFPLITNPDDIPANSHIKDLDNEYDAYAGTWKSVVGNKTVTLKITKVIDKPSSTLGINYFRDVLIVQHKIEGALGIEIENYISNNLNNYKIISTLYSKNNQLVRLAYDGVQCDVGWGLISIKLINPTQFEWNYNPNSSMLTNINCPNYPSGGIKVYLPYDPKNIISPNNKNKFLHHAGIFYI